MRQLPLRGKSIHHLPPHAAYIDKRLAHGVIPNEFRQPCVVAYEVASFVLIAVIVAAVLWSLRRSLRARHGLNRWQAFSIFTTLCVAIIGWNMFLGRFPAAAGQSATAGPIWDPAGVSDFAGRLGILPFLLYSRAIERAGSGNLMMAERSARPPSPDEVQRVVDKYLDM